MAKFNLSRFKIRKEHWQRFRPIADAYLSHIRTCHDFPEVRFDEATETWYFSIVDVIAFLSESVNPRDYLFRMKVSVKSDDGLELSTICAEPGDFFSGEL